MSRKVGHVLSLLQIPNLDERVGGSGAKDEAVRMKLGTGGGWRAHSRVRHTNAIGEPHGRESHTCSRAAVITPLMPMGTI